MSQSRPGSAPQGPFAGYLARLALPLALLGLLSFLLASGVAGWRLPGYSPWLHPLALPGARGFLDAGWFNALVFILPGLLMLAVAEALHRALPPGAGRMARIGVGLVQLAALAFALQGLWPLDPGTLDSGASRLHAAAWLGWWSSFAAGALLLAWRLPALRLPGLAAAVLVLGAGVLPAPPAAAGLLHRAACLAWFGWFAWSGWCCRRGFSRGAA